MGYTRAAVKGVSWITSLRVLTRILTFVRLAILGRLLTPAQFGFFGIATLLLSLLEILTETGINVFLIQEKKHIKEYINSAWIVSIIRGILLGFIILIAAPFIALFFKSSEATPIIMLIAIVPFIRGFINPVIITYQKDLLFHNEFKLRSILFFIDVFISIFATIVTKNASGFVYGLIGSALIEVILSYKLFTLWPKLQVEYEKIKYIFHRGGWVTLTGIFLYFADNGDNIAVGKILSSASLGIYQIAYKFSTLPISEVTTVINQVIFPVYSRFFEDRQRLWNAFIKVTAFSSLVGFLLGCAIFIFAEPIIIILMGDQWIAAVPVIKVLSIYGILRTIFGNLPPLFLAVGKQKYVAQATLLRTIGLLVSIVPFVISFGMVGAGYAMLFSMFLEIPILIYFTFKIFRLTK